MCFLNYEENSVCMRNNYLLYSLSILHHKHSYAFHESILISLFYRYSKFILSRLQDLQFLVFLSYQNIEKHQFQCVFILPPTPSQKSQSPLNQPFHHPEEQEVRRVEWTLVKALFLRVSNCLRKLFFYCCIL
jgi:hypothetical protein